MEMELPVERDILVRPPQIMGKSTKILKIFKEIKKIASKDIAVLISGESGTYKEFAAKAIHYISPRKAGPFVAINLASTPSELIETEMFGYEKDSFPNARVKKHGKVKEADGGTLFIEEIAEMGMNLQEKFLRFMQDKDPGSGSATGSDVRIIGATSRDIKDVVKKGQMNKDFYECFKTAQVKIPPLRERREDILPLAHYFLKQAVEKFETGPKDLSKDAREYLLKYDWPCNMRELENTMKRAAILSTGAVIRRKDLMIEDIGSCSIKEFLEEKLRRYLKEMTKLDNCNLFDTVLSEVEQSLIAIVLRETGGNQLRTAKTLGINRNTLRAKIKEYKIRI